MALRASDEARQIDQMLQERGKSDRTRFSHLKKAAAKRGSEPAPKKKSSGGWAEKIATMRETYPNAYRPWQAADDAVLTHEFQNGKTITALSKQLGRHEGSIKMRLQKHFGEDAIS